MASRLLWPQAGQVTVDCKINLLPPKDQKYEADPGAGLRVHQAALSGGLPAKEIGRRERI